MSIKKNHLLVTLLFIAVAVILIVGAANLNNTHKHPILTILCGNFGTATLAFAILEFIFKSFLQTDLIEHFIELYKKRTNLPVEAIYFGREKLQKEQGPLDIIKSAHEEVYIKAISFRKLLEEDFLIDLEKYYEDSNNKRIRLHFLLLTPNFKDFEGIASLTNLEKEVIITSIKDFHQKLDKLRRKNYPVDYVFYESFPTSGYWLVDPNKDNAWCRVEIFLFQNEDPSTRMNIIFRKKDDINFFNNFKESTIAEWKKSLPIIDKWPSSIDSILCISYTCQNLSELRDFYRSRDPLIKEGIRGSDILPPRQTHGILRFVDPDHIDQRIDIKLTRPSGFIYDSKNERFFLASQGSNSILEIDKNGLHEVIAHKLFNHIHSIDYLENRIAVACSGTDSIIVFKFNQEWKVEYCWISTENKYNTTPRGVARVVDRERDHRFLLYPTLSQCTHINSVVFSRSDNNILYASLFHQGQIIKINIKNNETEIVQKSIKHPHGLKTDKNGGFIFTSADGGHVHFSNNDFSVINPIPIPYTEWVQDACSLSKNEFLFSDVYNSSLKVMNLKNKEITGGYSYEKELKVYQVRSLSRSDFNKIQSWLKNLSEIYK